jgi:preprotein translocase subunit YajC
VPLAIAWLVIMVGGLYVLIWRPQQRRMNAVRALQSMLQQGDDVMTTSGIYGRIARLGDADVDLEIAPGTVIKVARGAIGERLVDDGKFHDGEFHDGAHDEGTEAG